MKFSIDHRGEWSAVQARKVLDIIGPEAEAVGINLILLDVTTHSHEHPRFIITAETGFTVRRNFVDLSSLEEQGREKIAALAQQTDDFLRTSIFRTRTSADKVR
jgi:hypothetical protein